MKRIQDPKAYKEVFSDSEQRKLALGYALEIRKFEIDLYWKRATYFWTLLAATFAGYFALAAADKGPEPVLLFLISCIGLVLSVGWYLVNRGSKYWQVNWERHVDSLEDEFMGPLYKTNISGNNFPWWKFWDGSRFSVSKINQLISLFVVVVWLGLAVSSFPAIEWGASFVCVAQYLLAGVTALFLLFLFTLGRSGRQDRDRKVDFVRSDLISAKDEQAKDEQKWPD